MEGMKSGEVEQGLSDTQDQLDNIEKMLQEDRLDDAMKALEDMSETLTVSLMRSMKTCRIYMTKRTLSYRRL